MIALYKANLSDFSIKELNNLIWYCHLLITYRKNIFYIYNTQLIIENYVQLYIKINWIIRNLTSSIIEYISHENNYCYYIL